MNIITFDEIDSTQLEAKRMIENGSALNGTIIVAKNQTSGLGTHGRKWVSKKDESITFSIILEPNCHIDKLNNFTLDIAKCIVEVIYKKYNIKLDIKKPNDIVFNGKKIGGILTETKVLDFNVKYVIIGIGMNTNQVVFDDKIKDIATSIKKEFDININNDELISDISKRIYNILF
ncbi:MAG: biotin--[acetyl-CoA-carboxylase] ligase [Clostridia bacterium]|nr:biotin--[acetyl-CoA-carboxylase] ligase [Clostridia bacterium]